MKFFAKAKRTFLAARVFRKSINEKGVKSSSWHCDLLIVNLPEPLLRNSKHGIFSFARCRRRSKQNSFSVSFPYYFLLISDSEEQSSD
mgnify:CR=1 FL=1